MSVRKHSVKVGILGEEYSLRTDAPPEHVRAIAGHVDELIRRLMHSGGVVETHKAAVLAALQLTDELFRARASLAEATAGVRQLSGEVGAPVQGGEAGGADDDDWFGDEGPGGRG